MKGKTNSNISELLNLLLFLSQPRTMEEMQQYLNGSRSTVERRIKEVRSMGFDVVYQRRIPAKGVSIHEHYISFINSQIPQWWELARLIGQL